jgi:hypothetical protein
MTEIPEEIVERPSYTPYFNEFKLRHGEFQNHPK